VLKFITAGYDNFDPVEMSKRESMIYSGAVTIRDIIDARGTLEIKTEAERPSIFPPKVSLSFDIAKTVGSHCPYCDYKFKDENDKRDKVRKIEGCMKYLCCSASACG